VIAPEFSRSFALNTIGTTARSVTISAESGERSALATRFDLVAIDRLEAQASLVNAGDAILCTGVLSADVTQACVATADPVRAKVNTDFAIRFVAHLASAAAADEIEIDIDDCDMIEHDGQAIDLGEAVAQTLLLALDPFPRTRGAAKTLKAAGVIGEDELGNSAFAGLKGLLGKP
jgi:uncharacterized metal-binding protein YceD (DUF177 family)